ncbi:hypothetical protein FRC04_001760 [Tulasnella sp. 424]|nr:hypothetical protein FRC04_001760 [Tulasnella sp. 424]
MSVLGGNSVQATNAEYFAFKHSSNPWLPKARLGHGYAFVGLPGSKLRDDLIGVDGPLVRPLFVGFQKPEDPSRTGYHYMGTYEFSLPSLYPQPKLEDDAAMDGADEQEEQLEQRFLAPEEWETLTESFRNEYTKMASPRYGISPTQLAHEYVAGLKGCPFRLAKCTGYDNEIYQRLKSRDTSRRPQTAKQKAQESSSQAAKRKREHDDSLPSRSSKRLQDAGLGRMKEEEQEMDIERT